MKHHHEMYIEDVEHAMSCAGHRFNGQTITAMADAVEDVDRYGSRYNWKRRNRSKRDALQK